MFRKIKINFKRGKNMTLLNKIITRYMLVATLILSSGYMVKLDGAECSMKWGFNITKIRETAPDGHRHAVQTVGELSLFGVYYTYYDDRSIYYDNEASLHYDRPVNLGINAVNYVKEHLAKNFFEGKGTTKEKLKKAFLETDYHISVNAFKKFLKSRTEDTSGAEALVAVVEGNKLCIANVGSSRAIVTHENKVLVSTKQYQDDKLKILESKISSPAREIGNIALKFKGVTPDPDIYEYEYEKLFNKDKDDVLIVASRGLWNVMKDEEIAAFVNRKFDENKIDEEDWTEEQILKEGAEREEEVKYEESNNEQAKLVARALCNEAYKRGNTLNICVLIVKFGSLLRAKAAESLKGKLKKK